MDIHNYHPTTGEYLGLGVADPSPLEPGAHIVPGYATPVPPPRAAGRAIAVYRDAAGGVPQNAADGAWTAQPDYRGVPLYRTADGSRIEADAEYGGIGDLPPFLTDEPRPGPAHVWRDEGWQLDDALAARLQADQAAARRDGLLAEAEQRIAPLLDGFLLGELTEPEAERLRSMSQYRKALRAIDPAAAQASAWPQAPWD